MKRGILLATLALGIAFGASFAFYAFIEGNGPEGFLEWLQSLFRRALAKGEGAFSQLTMSTDPTAKALDLIASQEGFSAKAYWDVDGYSIGYGHHFTEGDGFTPDSVITEAQGWELLKQDAASRISAVQSAVKVPVNTNQLAALISFTYNEGISAFQSSTLLSKLNSGDYDGAATEFGRWVYAGGEVKQALVSRRQTEMDLFVTPV